EGGLGLVARILDGELAEVIAERLAGPGDVTVDLGLNLVIGERGVLAEVLLGLFAGPSLGVDAGVDDQAGGAPGLVAEHAEGLVGSLVDAHLGAEAFAVERPA